MDLSRAAAERLASFPTDRAALATGAATALGTVLGVPALGRVAAAATAPLALAKELTKPKESTDDAIRRLERELATGGKAAAAVDTSDDDIARLERELGKGPEVITPVIEEPVDLSSPESDTEDKSAAGGVAPVSTRFVDKVVGGLEGAVEAVAGPVANLYEKAGVKLPKRDQQMAKQFRESYDAGKASTKQAIADRDNQSLTINALEDAYDTVAAIPRIGMSLVEEVPVDVDARKQARETVSGIPGAVAGRYVYGAAEDPVGYLRTFPVSTAVDLAPVVGQAAKLAKMATTGRAAAASRAADLPFRTARGAREAVRTASDAVLALDEVGKRMGAATRSTYRNLADARRAVNEGNEALRALGVDEPPIPAPPVDPSLPPPLPSVARAQREAAERAAELAAQRATRRAELARLQQAEEAADVEYRRAYEAEQRHTSELTAAEQRADIANDLAVIAEEDPRLAKRQDPKLMDKPSLVSRIPGATAVRRFFKDAAAQDTPYKEIVAAALLDPNSALPTRAIVAADDWRDQMRGLQQDVPEAVESVAGGVVLRPEYREALSQVPEARASLIDSLSKALPIKRELLGNAVDDLFAGRPLVVPYSAMQRFIDDAVDVAAESVPAQTRGMRTEMLRPFERDADAIPLPVDVQHLLPDIRRVPKDLQKSLVPQLKMEAPVDPSDVPRALIRAMKANLTSNNPASILNNLGSNVLLQVFRRGPVGAAQAGVDAVKHATHLKRGTGEYTRVYDVLQQLKLLDKDALTAEIGKAATTSPAARAYEAVTSAGGVLPTLYQAGDKVLKLEETIHNLDKYRGYLDGLKDGQYVELRMTPRFFLRVENDAGDLRANVYSNKGVRVSSEPIAISTDLQTITPELVRAAAQPALDAFFDYSDIPNLGKLSRHPMLAMFMPFTTWQQKALDLPGKRGLVYEAMLAPDGVSRTNSPSIIGSTFKDGVLRSAGRATVLEAAKQELLNEDGVNARKLAQMVSYLPKSPRITIVRALTSPANESGEVRDMSYIRGMTGGNWNFAGPTETLARLAAWSLTPDREKTLMEAAKAGGSLTPEQLKELYRDLDHVRRADMGQLADKNDVLTLIGMGANSIAETINRIEKDEELGVDTDMGEVLAKTLTPGIGGGAATALGAAINKWLPTSPLADRNINTPADKKAFQETITRVAVRRLLGMAWRTLPLEAALDTGNLDQLDKYFIGLTKEFLARAGADPQRIKDMRAEAGGYFADGKTELAESLNRKADMMDELNQIILGRRLSPDSEKRVPGTGEIPRAREELVRVINRLRENARNQPRQPTK